jgi:CHAT domain-containing protein
MDQEELGNTDLEINVIEEYADVIYTLESEEFDLLHISTHAKYEGHNTSPAFSTVKLKGNDELRPEDIKGKATSFGRFKPFVILNACQTGAQGYSFTRVEGWPRRFIVDSRSSVFIGTLWQATDKAATKFTKALYNELRKGTVLGEAVRLARINCKERGDPSWLAYQLYGHPNVQINIGQG